MANITGTSHNDHRTGTSGADDFDMSQGGNDVVHGLGGADTFHFGATLTAQDHIFGGGGNDTVVLAGDYSVNDILGAKTLIGVENVDLTGAFDYYLTFADGNVARNHTLIVDASALASPHHAIIDATAENGGRYEFLGGAGDDQVDAGTGNDTFYGGDGNDTFSFGGPGTYTAKDKVDGGAGFGNTIGLTGDYSGGLVLHTSMMKNIYDFNLDPGFSYSLDFRHIDGSAFTGFITIDGSGLGAGDVLTVTTQGVTGSSEFNILGGAGKDVLTGSSGSDYLVGGGGADLLTGGPGNDVYEYQHGADSTGTGYDTVVGFDTDGDHFLLEFTANIGFPAAFKGKLTHGDLSTAHFNSDLAHAMNAKHLPAGDAALFHPDGGSLAGKWFLVVDANGEAGYQSGDLVVYLEAPKHISHFGYENFGTAG